jgi:hypothetical protein
MPQTRVSCPNCRQPITAEINQLIDVGADPSLKQKFLSGAVNFIQCPACRYQGTLATYVVYHDPDKELLLSFIPAELGLPRNEQERLLGGLINQAINRLPQEKRKGYLLRPQQTLTYQGLVERVLEADGITREMIEGQQKKVLLIQKLIESSPEQLPGLISENEVLIDAEFFSILRRLAEMSMANQDQETAQMLSNLQRILLEKTAFGQELVKKNNELAGAVRTLQELGDKLTREKLLDLVINAKSDIEIQAYASMARPLMDYQFFQNLSEKIDKSRGDGRNRLVELREKLLNLTRMVDEEMEVRHQNAREVLNQIVDSADIREAVQAALPNIDEFFADELASAIQNARGSGDLQKIGKLQQVQALLEEASAPPKEVEFVQELLSTATDEEMQRMLESRSDEVTDEFLEILNGLNMQVQNGEDKSLVVRLGRLTRMATKLSMARNFKG